MKSFVITVEDFFKMNQSIPNSGNFDEDKRSLLIPLYQREYRWGDDKIQALLNDIKKNSKFLGNIILDQCDDHYEIVDGQQRITTLVLILSQLYNRYSGHRREQENIINHLKLDGELLLKNDSVGDYLNFVDERIEVSINNENDVYCQKKVFSRAYDTIKNIIEGWENQTDVQDFKEKLFDCKLLVLINDEHHNTTPVEQLFLDINEKSQQLEVEDVFKGHCFGNFTIAQEELRDKWVSLKKISRKFLNFGYQDLSQYIYLYLLETENPDLKQNLSENGKHFLDGKTMDETEQIIDNMISFGNSVVEFSDNVRNSAYYFLDVCNDFESHKNQGNNKEVLKSLCNQMIRPAGKAVYQKTPLFFLISVLKSKEDLSSAISFEDFRKIITNLYVYMVLFVFNGAKKSKKSMDHTIYDAFKSENSIRNIVLASKNLRKTKVNEFVFPEKFDKKKHYILYTIMDNYDADGNYINYEYSTENGYSHEHFIINDNNKIEWKHGDTEIIINIPADFAKKNKERTINGIVLNATLNGSFGHEDIITKIEKIKTWFESPGRDLPCHVRLFIKYIEDMPEYQSLKNLLESTTEEDIKNAYKVFLNAYFGDDNCLLNQLQNKFKISFQTQQSQN